MEVRTILTPAEIAALPTHGLSGTACVVFDVLRATSTLLAALANGARRVFPVLTPDEAFALRRDRLPDALLGGERGGVRIEGFDLGNSPREYTPALVAGRDVITTTTNGTVALRACTGADTVLAAGLVNLDATAAWLRALRPGPRTLLLVCAGTGSRFALEDGLAAGALAARLGSVAGAGEDDATRALLALYDEHHGDPAGVLFASENGRRLVEIGLRDDVVWCARESVSTEVALLHEGAMQPARKLLPSSPFHENRGFPTTPKIE